MSFLRIKEAELGLRFDHTMLDTLVLSSVIHPNQTSHSLDDLLKRYGIPISERHTSLGDSLMTAELFLKILPLLEKRGISTLLDALKISEKSPLSRISF